MHERGFTLIELLAVLAILAVLLGIGTLDFSTMQKKYSVEKQTKELFTDIADLRLKAIYTKRLHRVTIKTHGISCQSYSREDEALANGTTVLSKSLKYAIRNKDGSSLPSSGVTIDFDFRGFTYDLTTIRVSSDTREAPFDCIIIANSRTNLGKMNGGTCDAK
ncbi:MAG TPA: prepilin-type N-terminal cleavage/methylation domain-containing protein [Geobacteraceae bacterium]|nr:prepilin-type N-terminal cleavage/methylation domain-containing protein [Geobacteraceae bacterium]